MDTIPRKPEDGIVYISIKFAMAIHNCCCGCGIKVITPLSPTDWKLIFDGETISLDPSIGNWSYECRSHYWINENKIIWAREWTDKEIKSNREYDRHLKDTTIHKKVNKNPWGKLKDFFS